MKKNTFTVKKIILKMSVSLKMILNITTAELLKASAGKEIMKTFDAIWYQMENTEVIIKKVILLMDIKM
jgi:hypothetical protein